MSFANSMLNIVLYFQKSAANRKRLPQVTCALTPLPWIMVDAWGNPLRWFEPSCTSAKVWFTLNWITFCSWHKALYSPWRNSRYIVFTIMRDVITDNPTIDYYSTVLQCITVFPSKSVLIILDCLSIAVSLLRIQFNKQLRRILRNIMGVDHQSRRGWGEF